MRKGERTPEYQVPGAREMGFQTHPLSALQYVVGALIPPHAGGPEDLPGFAQIRQRLDTPVGLWGALASQLLRFRAAIEAWKAAASDVLGHAKQRPGSGVDLSAMQAARRALEQESAHTAIVLQTAREKLGECVAALTGKAYHLHLGLPVPLTDAQLAGRTSVWMRAARACGAFDRPQDSDLALLLARVDALSDEMMESLREIGKRARRLWTNEPKPERVTKLLQWVFDLNCECLEMGPVLACLEAPLAIWREAARPAEQPAPEAAASDAPDAQEPAGSGAACLPTPQPAHQ